MEAQGTDPNTSEEGNRDTHTTENLPLRQARVEKEPHGLAFRQFLKWLSMKLGGDQLMTSAEAATTGDLKTLLEDRWWGQGRKSAGSTLGTPRLGAPAVVIPLTLPHGRRVGAVTGIQLGMGRSRSRGIRAPRQLFSLRELPDSISSDPKASILSNRVDLGIRAARRTVSASTVPTIVG